MKPSRIAHNLLFAVFTLVCVYGNAQKAYKSMALKEFQNTIPQIESLISKQFGQPISLKLDHSRKTALGVFEQYSIKLNGVSIHEFMLKRSQFMNGRTVIHYPDFRFSASILKEESTADRSAQHNNIITLYKELLSIDYVYFIENNIAIYTTRYRGVIGNRTIEYIVDDNGEILKESILGSNSKPDSTVVAQIFLPDPITSSETVYDNPLSDSAIASLFADEYVLDSIPIQWDSANIEWRLESDFAIAADLADPLGAPPTSPNGLFNFERNDYQFEFVNAYYHINKHQKHLQALGFFDAANYPIRFDGHSGLGDQSFYQFLTDTTGQLNFGDGGVDDAEDADVIVHEYSHAVITSLAPNTNQGLERFTIEEAVCDFFALSSSRAVSDYQRDIIFNWDGHNEYWAGRQLTYTRTYPSELENDGYLDAPMWTSALADMYDYMGREETETLLIHSIYGYFPYMTMIDAAELIMVCDTLLNDAQNAVALEVIFCNRGLMKGCEDTLTTQKPLNDPFVGGLEQFTENTGPIYIYPNRTTLISYELYNVKGQLLRYQEFDTKQSFYEAYFPLLANGVYILSLNTNEGPFSFKLIKQLD